MIEKRLTITATRQAKCWYGLLANGQPEETKMHR